MSERLAAKPALHNGTWFRSRLEASWAAFLDHHAVKWTYEQEWFNFGDGTRYLPDFWLPESRAWMEVKGVLTDDDLTKVKRLAGRAQYKNEIVIIAGAPAGQVFGEVQPNGRRVAIDMVRCRHCDLWTFSVAECRGCGAWDGENTYDDVHRLFGGSCSMRYTAHGDLRSPCGGVFIYDGQGLHDDDAERWKEQAYLHAGQLGIEIRR